MVYRGAGCKKKSAGTRQKKAANERHLEVSTTAADSADALISSVATVRGGEPVQFEMR